MLLVAVTMPSGSLSSAIGALEQLGLCLMFMDVATHFPDFSFFDDTENYKSETHLYDGGDC